MISGNKQIKGLLKSFKFALRGIIFCLKNERNMRIHCCTAVLVAVFALIYGVSPFEFAVLFIAMSFVVVCEMVNTAIEALVDLQTSAYADLARIAKDVAAGAVLVSAVCAVLCGIAMFLHFPKLADVIIRIFTTPYIIIPIAAYIVFAVLFIFKGFEMFNFKKQKR